jgi:hypothetical protein
MMFLAEIDVSFVPQLREMLQYYSDWGTAVGVGMFSCMMFATLLGVIIREL